MERYRPAFKAGVVVGVVVVVGLDAGGNKGTGKYIATRDTSIQGVHGKGRVGWGTGTTVPVIIVIS